MKISNFDKKFEAGEDITDLLDLTKARHPGLEAKKINETPPPNPSSQQISYY